MFATQAQKIEKSIESLMALHGKDITLEKIYDSVVEELGVPRPTVRRVAGDMRIRYESWCKILNANCEPIPA